MDPNAASETGAALDARPFRDGWLAKLLYCLFALAVSCGFWAYYAHYWGTYENFNRSIEFCEIPYCDFVLYYYEQAKVIVESHAPIFKYFYSPTFALLLVPIGKLSYEQAVAAWTWVQALSLLWFVLAGVALLRSQRWWTHAIFLLLTLSSHPILHNWKWGQANTLFIAWAMTSLAIGERAHPSLRALPLALATACRYYPAMYALRFVERKYWRTIPWFVGLSLFLLFAVPALAMGPRAAWDFYRASAEASSAAATGWVLSYGGSQYMASVMARVGAAYHLDTLAARNFFIGLGYAISLLNFVSAVRTRSFSPSTRPLWAFCFIGACTPLLLPTSWMHYFVYLPLAQTFTLSRIVYTRMHIALRASLLVVAWLPSVVLSSVFFFNELGPAHLYSSGGYLFFSSMLMLALAHGLAWRARQVGDATA